VSDERLRELERRWRETGADEDEAAWVRERVRQARFTATAPGVLAQFEGVLSEPGDWFRVDRTSSPPAFYTSAWVADPDQREQATFLVAVYDLEGRSLARGSREGRAAIVPFGLADEQGLVVHVRCAAGRGVRYHCTVSVNHASPAPWTG
jgi:hypothetical protein